MQTETNEVPRILHKVEIFLHDAHFIPISTHISTIFVISHMIFHLSSLTCTFLCLCAQHSWRPVLNGRKKGHICKLEELVEEQITYHTRDTMMDFYSQFQLFICYYYYLLSFKLQG